MGFNGYTKYASGVKPGSAYDHVVFYTALAGGHRIEEVRSDIEGGPDETFTVKTDAFGRYPTFYLPERYKTVYALFRSVSNTRVLMMPDMSQDVLTDSDTFTKAYAQRRPAASIVFGGQTGHPYSSVGSAGTFTLNDTADVALGSVAVKAVTAGNGTQTVIGVFGGTAMNMAGKIPVVWLKVENLAHLLSLNFWLGANGLANAYTWNLKENPNNYPWIAESTWVAITLPIGNASVSGTPPRAALTDLEVQVYDDSAGQVTVHFGGLGFVAQPAVWPNGVVSFTFDDGIATQVNTARPYLDKYGMRATAYVITETLWNPTQFFPNYFTLAQAHSLEDVSGWEIGTHAYTAAAHNTGYTVLGATDAAADMALAKAYLIGEGFAAPWHLSYPLGQWDNSIRTRAQAMFSSARTLDNVTEETLPAADALKLRTFPVSSATTLGAMTAAVDRAFAAGEWLIFTMHSVVASPVSSIEMSTANFQSLIDYVNTKGIPVRMVSEVLGTTV